MADEQEQSDEIMALQSIYEDDIFICNASKKPFTGKMFIFLNTDSEDHEFMCNGNVVPLRHLSPLILNFSLPLNYPSTSPPDVTLSCLWLTSQQLEMLSDKLKEKWAENCDSVVLFTWIDFLKTEAIEALGIKFPIDVSEEKIMKLSEQSILRDEEIFRRGFHYCPVCLTEKPGTQCVRLSICGHVFCRGCLSEFLSVYIQEGTVNAINCPCEECDEQLYPNVIKSLVSKTDFDRYDRLLLQNTLDVMPDIKYCPRIQCQKPVVVDKDDGVGFCHACNFAFCTKCKLTYHGIEKCKWEREMVNKNTTKDRDPKEYFRQWDYWAIPEDERMRLASEYMEGDDEGREGLEEYYGKERMMDMLVDWQAQKWIKANTKKCPKCSTNIEKSYGCNKMACVKCGARFCWACSREIKSKNPYDHFSDPSSPCYNNLADVYQVREEEDEAEHFEMVEA